MTRSVGSVSRGVRVTAWGTVLAGVLSLVVPPVAEAASSRLPGLEVVTADSEIDGAANKGVSVGCPTGQVSLGGGAQVLGNIGHVFLQWSRGAPPAATQAPGEAGYGWGGEAESLDRTDPWRVQTQAMCVPVALASDAGLEIFEAVSADDTVPRKVVSLACPPGKTVIGGGALVGGNGGHVYLQGSYPANDTSWVGMAEAYAQANPWRVMTRAVCVSDAFAASRGLEMVTADSALDAVADKSAAARCPAGKTAISGGAQPLGNIGRVFLQKSLREDDDSWGALSESLNTDPWQIRAQVICVTRLLDDQVNRLPVVEADEYRVAEDTSLVVSAPGVLGNDDDPDGDPLTATLGSPPTWGSVTAFGGDGSFTFTPPPGRDGTVTFPYTAHDDSQGASAPAQVTITVTRVNDAPQAGDDAVAVGFGEEGTIDVAANDADADQGDGERLVVGDPSDPASGTATCSGRSCTYVPDLGSMGEDTFTYTVSDPAGATDTATVTVTVATPTAPAAAADTATTAEGAPATVPVTANDTPGQLPAAVELSTPPAHGSAACSGSDCRYTPEPGYHGQDSFAYTVTDTAGRTSSATVAMTVTAVNHPPVLTPPAQTVAVGGTPGPVAGADPDGDPLTYAAVGGALPAGVSLRPDGRFIGASANTGRTTARLAACDPSGACAEADQVVDVRWGGGYWTMGAAGTVSPLGDAGPLGGASGRLGGAPAADIDTAAGGEGYWILDRRGQVHPVGTAPAIGSLGPTALGSGESAVALVATPTRRGYRIVTDAGRVFPFGDATHRGDLAGVPLTGPVVDASVAPAGDGYWLVSRDGGVFAFGDAGYAGGLTGTRLNAPVVSMAADPDGAGYWLAAADGGVFGFDAPFRGSMPPVDINRPVVRIRRYGDGYLLAASDGGIFVYSNRPFVGSLGANPPREPVVAVAVTDP